MMCRRMEKTHPRRTPQEKNEEQESYQLPEKLVAVTRIERVTRGL
jgi:hypothetical protein